MSAHSCDPTSLWWVFLATTCLLYLLGLAASGLATLVLTRTAPWGCDYLQRTRKAFSVLLSPQKLSGKLLTVSSLVCNTVYYGLVLYYTTLPVRHCVEVTSSPALILELCISSVLLGLFLFRLLACHSLLQYWLNLLTVVDIFTLPHPFLVLLLGRDWLGLRTLRFLWLTEASQLFNLIPWYTLSRDALQVVKLVLRLVGMWLAMAGLVQMLEASGDPWENAGSVQNLTYLESAYFIVVTMSTVGYGDISPVTVLGQVVVTLFIVTGLAVYATALPTLVDIALVYYKTSQFTKNHSGQVSQYVVVCGHVTATTAAGFLKELLHPDRHDTTTHIVFLHPDMPTPELRQTLKAHYTRVEYLTGSPLSAKDLSRCGLQRAKACFVLADRFTADPLAEDRANLLQVASLKNVSLQTPVILQLLCGCSKELLHSIPGWTKRDVFLCLNELKLKILAQGCLTPGFTTLISNLFFASSPHQLPQQNSSSWRKLYTMGACKEIYSSPLSTAFEGMRVAEVAQVCFKELGLLLVAVVNSERSDGQDLVQENVVQMGAIGYFIADRAHDVECVRHYCFRCQSGHNKRKIVCCCTTPSQRNTRQTYFSTPIPNFSHAVTPSPIPALRHSSSPLQPSSTVADRLADHIVLCVFVSSNSTAIGLKHLISPLTTYGDIAIVCGAPEYLEHEMPAILQYPDCVHLVRGSPLEWSCLLRAGVEQSRLCVILTAPTPTRDRYESMHVWGC